MKPYTSDLFDRATAIAAQCFGKVTFPSWDAAHRIMRARQRNAKKAHHAHKQDQFDRSTHIAAGSVMAGILEGGSDGTRPR